MIIDDKLIKLCDRISKMNAATFLNPDFFVFHYMHKEIEISFLNRNHTSLMRVYVHKSDLKDYPSYPSTFILPVKSDDEGDCYLDFLNYHEYTSDDETDRRCLDLVSIKFDEELVNSEGYINYPIEVLNYLIGDSYETVDVKFEYKEFYSIISDYLFDSISLNKNFKNIGIKLIDDNFPVLFNYKTSFEDLKLNVYGAIAPRLLEEANYDVSVRVI